MCGGVWERGGLEEEEVWGWSAEVLVFAKRVHGRGVVEGIGENTSGYSDVRDADAAGRREGRTVERVGKLGM